MQITLVTAIATPDPARGILTCPVCGSVRVIITHLDCRGLGSTQGEVQVGPEGLRLDPAIANPEGGACVGLACVCDHGHGSVIRFRQVRGSTIVERGILPWAADPYGIEAGD